MKKAKKDKVVMTKVSRLSSDASLDYEIPLERAKQLYAEGKIAFDLDNQMFTSNLWQIDSVEFRRQEPGPIIK